MKTFLYLPSLITIVLLSIACEESPQGRPGLDGGGIDGLQKSHDGLAPTDQGDGTDSTYTPSLNPCRRPQKEASFTIPVSHADARWKRRGTWAGRGVQGYLDGPRHQIRSYNAPGRSGFFESGGEYVYRIYDDTTGRYLTLAGSARGYLDGPFSRARFGGWGYSAGLRTSCGPDGALYIFEPNLGVIRRMDFDAREVTTVTKDVSLARAMVFDGNGVLLIVGYGDQLTRVHPDGMVDKITIEAALIGHGFSVAMDRANNRLYGANRCSGEWYIWYWDLNAEGKFVGVLSIPQEGEPSRDLNATGPFEGTYLHCPAGISFGRKPDYKTLYYGGGDNTTFFRLDLTNEWIDTWGPIDEEQETPYEDLGWVEATGKFPSGSIVSWAGTPSWDGDDIFLGNSIWPSLIYFERVQ
ncbi:MAG: hypothetical protein JRH20_15220 [Deltaproteobacteria bacterium]|nr:hypothetical protein [Deltaproteobacteria bacterium]